MMVSAGAEIGDCDLAPSRGMLVATPPSAALARLQRLRAAVGALARDAPDILADPEAARGAEQALIEAMVACLAGAKTPVDSVTRQHHAIIICRFQRLLGEAPDQAHYIPELCAALRVSERTLRACRHEHLGMGPNRFLVLRRMHLTHRALRCGAPGKTNVTEVATRFGFWQLGRFAVEYKKLFGESPSTPLAQAPDRALHMPDPLPKLHCQGVAQGI